MEFVLNIILLALGMIFLIKGADVFVDGASSIAKRLKVPSLVIGLTIVALGTSLPELAVSVVAAINGKVEMSVGNVVGSNIFNILMVLGSSALIFPLIIDKKILKFELPFVFFISILLLVISITGEKAVTWYYGLVFIILLVFYIAFLIFRTKKEGINSDGEEPKLSVIRAIVALILGSIAIALGGEVVNRTAVFIASFLGMSEQLIALTIVAMGTSLPELVTSVVAAKKGEKEIALGNVIGSNTLNILFILGIASLIHPLAIKHDLLFDLLFMVGITALLFVMAIIAYKKKGLYRVSGIILIALYVVYMIYIICRQYNVLPSFLVI